MTAPHYPDLPYLEILAQRASEIMRKNFHLGMKKEWKSDGTPVTTTDIAVDTLVTETVKRDFAHLHILSEEGAPAAAFAAEYVLICDPLDGTIPFSHGIPISTFCVSVLQNGKPIVALIHDPFLNRTWSAVHSEGSFCNGKKNTVSKKYDLKGSIISALFSPLAFPQVYRALEYPGAFLMNCCSAAYFGGLIASGEAVASIFATKTLWETPAMQLIVEEAGGKATDLRGNGLNYSHGAIDGHIISNGFVHDMLIRLING